MIAPLIFMIGVCIASATVVNTGLGFLAESVAYAVSLLPFKI